MIQISLLSVSSDGEEGETFTPTAYFLKDKRLCCCFTGHRNIAPSLHEVLRERLLPEIFRLYEEGVRHFVVGGAVGFDTIAGEAVLKARDSLGLSDVTLTMALPCYKHDLRWNTEDRRRFRALAAAANDVLYVSEKEYFQGCMQKRNRFMVDRCGYCICYMSRTRGGTYQTVREARAKGLRIIALPILSSDSMPLL